MSLALFNLLIGIHELFQCVCFFNQMSSFTSALWDLCENLAVFQINRRVDDGGPLREEGEDSARRGSGPPEALPEGRQLPALLGQSHHSRHVPGGIRTNQVRFHPEGKWIGVQQELDL